MKFILIFGLPALFFGAVAMLAQPAAGQFGESDGSAFAVVELFTSEGCSSCPPADRLLAEIVAAANESGRRVFCLSFHVDYWNHIGWRDPYSNAAFSDRQRSYAQVFESSRIYTPQMIVNGRTEFVGSNRSKVESAITSALSEAAVVALSLNLVSSEAKEVVITYNVPELPKGAVVNFALVERGLFQEVKRGENSGRRLPHENVVRAFRTQSDKSGSVALRVPAGMKLKNSSVIALVQDASTMKVLGAETFSF